MKTLILLLLAGHVGAVSISVPGGSSGSTDISGKLDKSGDYMTGGLNLPVSSVTAQSVVAGQIASTGSITGSSATLTATGDEQFSLETSSGIDIGAGGIYAAFGRFTKVSGDGSALTNLSVSGSTGTRFAQVTAFGGTFTNTDLICVASATITMENDGHVFVQAGGAIANDTGGANIYLGYLKDSANARPGFEAIAGVGGSANQYVPAAVLDTTTASAGAHTYCVWRRVSSGTGNWASGSPWAGGTWNVTTWGAQ